MGVLQLRSGHLDCEGLGVAGCEKVAKLSARCGQLGGVRRQDLLAMCATNKRSEGRSRVAGVSTQNADRRGTGGEAQNRRICMLLPTPAHAESSALRTHMTMPGYEYVCRASHS